MHGLVPAVEIPDDAHLFRVGSPDGEVHAVRSFPLRGMRAQEVIQAAVAALPEQGEVALRHDVRVES